MTAAEDPVVAAARGYTERGWAVLLLAVDGAGGKIPPANCEKCNWRSEAYERHLAADCGHLLCHGFYAATTDFTRFLDMLKELPNGHLAIRTGRASRLLVIDAEAYAGKEGEPTGLEVLDEWGQWTGWWLPTTLASRSVQGGTHLYYRIPQDAEIGSGRVLPGVDVKCENGYVGAVSGITNREWVDPSVPVADAPEVMLDWLTKTKRLSTARGPAGSAAGGAEAVKPDGYDFKRFQVEGCPDGHRDYFFNELLFRLRKQGLEQSQAEEIAYHEWTKAAQPGGAGAAGGARYEMPWDDVAYKVNRVWAQVAPDADHPSVGWAKTVLTSAQQQLAAAAPVEGSAVGGGGDVPVLNLGIGTLEGPDHWYGAHDDGTAERMRVVWGNWFRAIPRARGGYTWLCFDACTWVPDQRDRVFEAVGYVVTQVQAEVGRWETRCAELVAERMLAAVAAGVPEDQAADAVAAECQADWRTRRILGRGATAGEFEVVAGLRKYAAALREVARKETGLKTFARLPQVTIAEEDLDANSALLALADGRVLDVGAVHDGQPVGSWLRTPEPGMLLTKRLGCGFVPEDPGVPGTVYALSRFAGYLETALPDATVRATVQEIVGYALLGDPKEKLVVLLHGPGDTGKTVLLEVLEALFADYGGWADAQALVAGKAKSAHTEWLHKLRGLRAVLTPETAKGAKIDAAWMKSYTGREPQTTRGAYGDRSVTWKPQGIIFNASNHYLEYDAGDTAVAERTQVVEFEEQFPRGHEKRDDQLAAKIRERELAVVLNWALEGLRRHGERGRRVAAGKGQPGETAGIQICAKIRSWSERYRTAQDHVGQFVLDAQEEGFLRELIGAELAASYESHYAPAKTTYLLYVRWCDAQKRKPLGRNTFNKHLEQVYGWVLTISNGRRWRAWVCSVKSDLEAQIVQW